jgi:recombination protein RecA
MPKTIDDLLSDFEKKNDLKVGQPADVIRKTLGLSTGNLAIDYLTGVGGLPQGRITELYGLPSSGKTTTALQAAVNLQKSIIDSGSDERILYLDFEHALDGDYASELGLDLEHPSFLLAQPHWLEQGAEAALALIDTGKIRMSIWDSVAAMAPKRLIDGGFDQATSAMHRAKLLSGLMQTLASLLHQKNCAGVFINHMMESVEMTGRPGLPPKTTTPGGRALKYYSSIRLEYKQGKNIKAKMEDMLTGEDADQLVATQVIVKCVKNKVGPPFRTAECRSRFGMGFDNAWSAVQVLIGNGLVVQGTAGYYYFDTKKVPDLVHADMAVSGTGRPHVQGEANLMDFADDHPEWRDILIGRAVQVLA